MRQSNTLGAVGCVLAASLLIIVPICQPVGLHIRPIIDWWRVGLDAIFALAFLVSAIDLVFRKDI